MLGAGFLHFLFRNVRKWRLECHRLPQKVAFLKFQSLIYFILLLFPFPTFIYSFTHRLLNEHLKYVRQFLDWKYNSETHKVFTFMVFTLFTLQYILYAKCPPVIGLWWKWSKGREIEWQEITWFTKHTGDCTLGEGGTVELCMLRCPALCLV